MIIAVVGSGGKTTLIKALAQRYRSQGRSVFVTTTTHMYIEADTVLSDDADVLVRQLTRSGYVMAGIPEGEKIRALSRETYLQVCAGADVVLLEADGSKGLPLKYPNETEPVIPDNADKIIIVWGPHGLGHPAAEVCHRPELVKRCLGIEDGTLITRTHIRELVESGYLIPLKKSHPEVEIEIYPSL